MGTIPLDALIVGALGLLMGTGLGLVDNFRLVGSLRSTLRLRTIGLGLVGTGVGVATEVLRIARIGAVIDGGTDRTRVRRLLTRPCSTLTRVALKVRRLPRTPRARLKARLKKDIGHILVLCTLVINALSLWTLRSRQLTPLPPVTFPLTYENP